MFSWEPKRINISQRLSSIEKNILMFSNSPLLPNYDSSATFNWFLPPLFGSITGPLLGNWNSDSGSSSGTALSSHLTLCFFFHIGEFLRTSSWNISSSLWAKGSLFLECPLFSSLWIPSLLLFFSPILCTPSALSWLHVSYFSVEG